jgi:uncharacterized protein
MWVTSSRGVESRSLRFRTARKLETIRPVLEVYRGKLRKDVLGGKPLEKHTTNTRKNTKNSGRSGDVILTPEEGEALVRTARSSIDAHFSGLSYQPAAEVSSSLKEQRGVFVTLLDPFNGNNLRGCIGIPFPTRPLIEQVRIAAVEAATQDPRFEPVNLNEFESRIALEATVLSPMEPIWVKNPLDLRENIVIGRDGLIVEGMCSHGLLLPQVAVDEDFDTEEFLSQCCLKAGLPPDAWLTGRVQVSRFQGQVFAEDRPKGRVVERPLKPKS